MLILLSPSHPLFDLVTQHHLFFIEERARCMARDQIMVAKGTMLTAVPLPKRIFVSKGAEKTPFNLKNDAES